MNQDSNIEYRSYDEELNKRLFECFRSKLLCDVVFSVTGDDHRSRDFYAHAVVLASVSRDLRRKFENLGPFSHNEPLQLEKACSVDVFQCFLDFVYTDKPIITQSNAFALCKLAEEYNVDKLVLACYDYIDRIIHDETQDKLELLVEALRYEDDRVNQITDTFLKSPAQVQRKILSFDKIPELTFEIMLRLVQSNDLKLKEENIWRLCVRWQADDYRRHTQLKDLVQNIRLRFVDIKFVRGEVESSDLIDSTQLRDVLYVFGGFELSREEIKNNPLVRRTPRNRPEIGDDEKMAELNLDNDESPGRSYKNEEFEVQHEEDFDPIEQRDEFPLVEEEVAHEPVGEKENELPTSVEEIVVQPQSFQEEEFSHESPREKSPIEKSPTPQNLEVEKDDKIEQSSVLDSGDPLVIANDEYFKDDPLVSVKPHSPQIEEQPPLEDNDEEEKSVRSRQRFSPGSIEIDGPQLLSSDIQEESEIPRRSSRQQLGSIVCDECHKLWTYRQMAVCIDLRHRQDERPQFCNMCAKYRFLDGKCPQHAMVQQISGPARDDDEVFAENDDPDGLSFDRERSATPAESEESSGPTSKCDRCLKQYPTNSPNAPNVCPHEDHFLIEDSIPMWCKRCFERHGIAIKDPHIGTSYLCDAHNRGHPPPEHIELNVGGRRSLRPH